MAVSLLLYYISEAVDSTHIFTCTGNSTWVEVANVKASISVYDQGPQPCPSIAVEKDASDDV